MRQKKFDVLAETYHLIGMFDFQALDSASRHPGISEHVRAALAALAREHKAQGRRASSPSKPRRGQTNNVTRDGSGTMPRDDMRVRLINTLCDPLRFKDKASLIDLAVRADIPLPVLARDSRRRLAERLARLATEDLRITQRLLASVSVGAESQTEGWLKLILGEGQ